MTEDQARAALAAFDGLGGLERWIAEHGIRTTAKWRSPAARQAALATWTAGGPLARAVRAFLNRRGRP